MTTTCKVYQLPNNLWGYKRDGGYDYEFGNMNYYTHQDATLAAMADPNHCSIVENPYANITIPVPPTIEGSLQELGVEIFKNTATPYTPTVTPKDYFKYIIFIIIVVILYFGFMKVK